MSSSTPWKALERRTAKLFGGVRLWRPDYSDSEPDGESGSDVWDCKCYQRFSVVSKFVDCERKYRAYTAGRRFVLVLFSRAHPRAGDFVLARARDYARLVRIEQAAQEVLDGRDVYGNPVLKQALDS